MIATSTAVQKLHCLGVALIATTLVNACGGQSPSGPSATSSNPSTTRITRLELGVAGNAAAVVVPGSSLQLWALATHGDGSRTDATNLAQWQTSNPAIATVAAGGVFTAVTEGSVTVSAKYEESATLDAAVRKAGCEDSSLSPASRTYNSLAYGRSSYFDESFTLNAPMGCAWTLTGEVPWLGSRYGNFPYSGTAVAGGTGLSFFVDANNTAVARTGRLHVSVGGRDLPFTVTQEAAHCALILTPTETFLPSAGGEGRFEISTVPSDCTWVVDRDSPHTGDTLLSARMGTGHGEIRFASSANTHPISALSWIDINDAGGISPGARHNIHIAGR